MILKELVFMVKTRMNKLVAVFLAAMMTIAFWANVPINVHAESQADAIVSIALAEEGYTEGANNNNKYGAALGQNYVAWCALFISWCARQAGIPTSIIKTTAWAGDMGSSKRTGNFGGQYYPKGSITPQKGDIVYYDWNKNGSSDHVEIVVSVNESSKTFTSIGGNTKGDSGSTEGVRRHSNYSFTSNYIVGFERPNYNGSSNPPTQNNDDELGIPYPRPSGNPLMSIGSRGSGVSWLQTALNKANNAGLDVDGQFGSGTKQAVINFQKSNGLEADGIAGPATVNKLVEVIKGQMNPSKPPSAPDVAFKIDYDSGYLIFTRSKQENVERYKVEIGIVNGEVIVSNSNAIEDTYKWKFSQSDVSKDYYLKITAVNNLGSSSTTKYFTILPQKPNLESPNLSVDVNGQEVTFSWNLVNNATGYDLRIYNSDGTSYADYWDILSNENSLIITMPANTEFFATVCSKNSNFEECWCYSQPVYFETGSHEHKWDEWMTLKYPTCIDDGEEFRVCLECMALEERTINKTGQHNYVSKVIAPTCTENGYTLYTCSVCGDSYKNNTTFPKHNYSSKIIPPTFIEEGYTLYTCSKCGHIYKDNFIGKNKLIGDINSDGKLNISDAVLLQTYLLNAQEFSEDQWKTADINEDGYVDSFDMVLLRKKLINQ